MKTSLLIFKIFVDHHSRNELKSLIDEMNFENKTSFAIDIVKNNDFDKSKRKEFPDGFLYFPFLVEYYSSDSIVKASDIHNTGIILTELWKNNVPAVASCDYENILPEKGGYKSKNIPWVI